MHLVVSVCRFVYVCACLNSPVYHSMGSICLFYQGAYADDLVDVVDQLQLLLHPTSATGVIVLTSCVCVCVCVGLLRVHYTPLWYMGYLCTRKAQYAPPRRNMLHGAQGRLCFLKISGDLHVFEWVTWLIYRFTSI